jgi:hypothetical protein
MWWLSPESYPSFVELLPRATQTWLSTQDLCGGYHLGVILTLKKNLNALKCFDLENIG